MTQLQLATNLVRAATLAVGLKHRSVASKLRLQVAKQLARKQHEATEKDVAKALAPFFQRQVEHIANGLAKLGAGKSADAARNLVAQVFDPQEWRADLINTVLPVLARKMAQAGVAQLMLLGINVRRKSVKRVEGGPTTASEWVEEHSADWQRLLDAFAASGEPLGIITEIPDWMRRAIAEQLTATFEKPYWDKISATTQGDAEKFLRQGLDEGWSIPKIAREMRDHFLPAAQEGAAYSQATRRYATRRAERIARTESGHALNAARRSSMDELIGEVGPQVPMRPAWLSVLGNTTRDTHAMLDGVPADADGMWELGGVRVPWPGHIDLDVGERANCQCSIVMDFGMDEEEARRLIGEYEARVRGEEEAEEKPVPTELPRWTEAGTVAEAAARLVDAGIAESVDFSKTDLATANLIARELMDLNVQGLADIKPAPSSRTAIFTMKTEQGRTTFWYGRKYARNIDAVNRSARQLEQAGLVRDATPKGMIAHEAGHFYADRAALDVERWPEPPVMQVWEKALEKFDFDLNEYAQYLSQHTGDYALRNSQEHFAELFRLRRTGQLPKKLASLGPILDAVM